MGDDLAPGHPTAHFLVCTGTITAAPKAANTRVNALFGTG
ncbi:hypothetical protein FHR33_008421 [Nonomuraea dietziae]|uniref:Uncharacterized protein n=1 Tax=Nonomuraea dietziae TaxID=65515 RepID=A0A7W5YCL7_9ACTN|nr:hypothetical protein [Nonomuraea dietziae]